MPKIESSQLLLFDLYGDAEGIVELFPAVWSAAENLTSPDPILRMEAIERLIEMDAARLSPLIAYILATRVVEPDIDIRFKVVKALGELVSPPSGAMRTPGVVWNHIKAHLSMMRRREVYSLLQVAEEYPSSISNVAYLLNMCSYASNALGDILLDRKAPLPIRRQAINFVGRVGFLDAIPALERLSSRLESRLEGQTAMPFAPPKGSDETSLLPAVQATLTLLSSV
jgi:hypothetical protein